MPSFLGKPPTMTAMLTPVHASTTSVVATTPGTIQVSNQSMLSYINVYMHTYILAYIQIQKYYMYRI